MTGFAFDRLEGPGRRSRRTLHLLDLDSLVPGPLDLRRSRRWGTLNSEAVVDFGRAASVTGFDHVVILGMEATVDHDRIVLTPPYPADGPQSIVLRPHECASRYWRVVLGSGEHRYAPLAISLSAAGVRVVVVCRASLASVELAAAVHEVVTLRGDGPANGDGRC